jgi:DNA polymerase III epsilon subunit-like protein
VTWHTGPLLPFDLETTGPNPDTARIVTAFADEIGWNARGDRSWLADPGVPIPGGATAVHGITTDRARAQGRPAGPVVHEITTVLSDAADQGVVVIGHNVAYDLTVVDRECRRHDIDPPAWEALLVVDTQVLDKHVWTYRKGSRRLTDVAVTYGVPIRGDAHDAAADAMAAARIGYRIAQIGATPFDQRAPEHREIRRGFPTQHFGDAYQPAADLHHWQRIWAAEQAESLEAYFRRQPGRESEVVDREWPVRPLPAGWDPTAVDPIEVTA